MRLQSIFVYMYLPFYLTFFFCSKTRQRVGGIRWADDRLESFCAMQGLVDNHLVVLSHFELLANLLSKSIRNRRSFCNVKCN